MVRLLAAVSVLLLVLSRLAHLRLVWVEEAYGMAAAGELLRGKSLYSQVWFDKPPAYAWFYELCAAQAGWPLRILDAAYLLLAVGAIYLLAHQLWGSEEGLLAAALACWSLTFWIPSAVMALAPDLLMLVPHTLAVYFAVRRQAFGAGLCAGVAGLCNSKGILVVVAVLFWTAAQTHWVVLGFFLVQAFGLLKVSPSDYWNEVWAWGLRYSADTFISNPIAIGVARSAAWIGFNLTACTAALVCILRERQHRLLFWAGICLLSVGAGLRFFPRYYFSMLPVMSVCGARGLVLLPLRWRVACLTLLAIPAIRFGPRYFQLWHSGPGDWADTALMQDSKRAAAIVASAVEARDTLLVWGYRPDIFVFCGLPAGTRFLDSQPLTGVLADRHLVDPRPTLPGVAARNRAELVRASPTFVVDGLGALNPSLAIEAFSDLNVWLSRYQIIGRTRTTTIYQLRR